MVSYLQYVRNFYPGEFPRFLVSGVDDQVRQVVGQQIVSSCYARRKTLFLLDNTKTRQLSARLGGYRLRNAAEEEVCLCGDLFNSGSLLAASRLRALLTALGFDAAQAMQVVSYLNFVRETERRLGNRGKLTAQTLEEYDGMKLVEWKLAQLPLSLANREYLTAQYCEVSGAAADFSRALMLLSPFLRGEPPSFDGAILLPVGQFGADPAMQSVMCQLLLSCIAEEADRAALLILDDGMGERPFLSRLLQELPPEAEAHLLSRDVFSLAEDGRSAALNAFPVRIFARHQDMSSCAKVEALCGQIDVRHTTSALTVDRRWKSNSAWDMLLGNNRTETSTRSAPTREPRFRKETIARLAPGSAVLDCCGTSVLFSF